MSSRWIALAVALLASAVLAAPAGAALSVTGPLNPQLGFPAWYQDANGTQLELCVADPGCPISPPVLEPVAPNDEAFYSLVGADLSGPAGQTVNMELAIEAAFLDTPVTFGRVQVSMSGMQPNSDYTFTYPYGTAVWTTDGNGNMAGGFRAAARHEVGCFAGFATPCDITLGTEIGPFLTWDPAESAPPAGYIGNGLTPHTVVGATNNFVRVTGPGLPLAGIQTSQFTVEGKLASPPTPIFFVAAGSGDFGTQRVNATVSRTVTIKNNGLAPTQPITATAISGPDAASFAKGADTCTGATLASGQTCTVAVDFTPANAGALSASLDVTDAAGTNTVALTGTGGQSGLSASPAILNFLNQNVSTTTPESVVTINNTGPVSLNISGAAISGANADEFAITHNRCTGPVAPGGTCTIGLKFLPAASGPRNASLDIASDAAGSPQSVPLTGTGTVAPGAGTGTTPTPTVQVPKLRLDALTVANRMSLRSARRRGIQAVVFAPDEAKVVKARLLRNGHVIARTVRKVRGDGVLTVVLPSTKKARRALRPGTYKIQVTAGQDTKHYGVTSTRTVRIR
ncbi:MAG TPA: choice-of-anchor D domain-containing protein [Jatrophihabitantaceae bacterium]|jgi:hypothetical protein